MTKQKAEGGKQMADGRWQMADGRTQNTERGKQRSLSSFGLLLFAYCVLLSAFCLLTTACSLIEDVPPVADAGPDQTVKLGTPISLDASKSREIDGGKIIEYRWMITGVPKGKEGELNKVVTAKEPKVEWRLPNDDGAVGVWTFELRVMDDGGNRAANDLRVTVTK
jgi:hypothetical protein